MIRKLEPIKHREEYVDWVDAPIRAYLWEAIFEPLFEMIEGEGIAMNRRDQAIGRTPEFKNASDWTLFPPALRSLRMKRVDMPQIAWEDRALFVDWLESRGIGHSIADVLPHSLRPTQEGYHADKVEAAINRLGMRDPRVLVSSDGFILDGHHQWFARVLAKPEERMGVLELDAPIRVLVHTAKGFGAATFRNAKADDTILAALRAGRIWYSGGEFTGEFNAAISRRLRALGANWDSERKSYHLPLGALPLDLRQAVEENAERARGLHERVDVFLRDASEAIPKAATGMSLKKPVDKLADDLQKQFVRTVPALESISVPAFITPAMREAITQELTENLDFYIKKFASAEIPELRRMVEANAFDGARTARLARLVEARWGVSKRKARFLADQETSMLVSKYREQTYKRIGVQRYVWSTARDERVRAGHRRLDGRTFDWSSPPVVDEATGRRCHPGFDYRCRCTAIPILDLAEQAA